MVLKRCPNCGNQLKENAEFCNYCGEVLKDRKLKQNRINYNTKSKKSPRPTKKKVIDEKIYADFVYRFFAYLIDIVIIFIIDWIIFYLFYGVFTFYSLISFYIALHFVAYILGFFYFNTLETYNNGQTIGKLIFHIRSVNEETKKAASFRDNVINNVLKCSFISCLFDFIIGILKNYEDKKKKFRIMQNLSNAVVISSKKKP